MPGMGRNKPVFCTDRRGGCEAGYGIGSRAGLMYGLGKTEIQAFLTCRHGQSDHARFYAHGLVDSIRGQIRVSLQCSAGLNGVGRAADSLSSK